MTIVKTKGVHSAKHAANVAAYLDDPRAIMREGHNIIDPDRWADEMAKTRAAYHHDSGQLMLHQVLAINADDYGKLTPEDCMAYARDWLAERYPDQEAVIVLHDERGADGVPRWAIHLGIGVSDLETGRKLDEGHPRLAAIDRARQVMRMDAERGLTVTEGRGRYSLTHAQQPTRAEQEIRARGQHPWKDELRARVSAALSSPDVRSLPQLADALRDVGVALDYGRSRREMTLCMDGHRPVRASRLGCGLDRATVEKTLASRARALENEPTDRELANVKASTERLRDAILENERAASAVADAIDAMHGAGIELGDAEWMERLARDHAWARKQLDRLDADRPSPLNRRARRAWAAERGEWEERLVALDAKAEGCGGIDALRDRASEASRLETAVLAADKRLADAERALRRAAYEHGCSVYNNRVPVARAREMLGRDLPDIAKQRVNEALKACRESARRQELERARKPRMRQRSHGMDLSL